MVSKNENNATTSEKELKTVTLKEFFEITPPSTIVLLKDLECSSGDHLSVPTINSYCSHDSCKAEMFFSPNSKWIDLSYPNNFVLSFSCKNCSGSQRKISFLLFQEGGAYFAYKFGEYPPFGPHIPSRVIKLIGDEIEIFQKGRRCENQGLGIGAFAYYRRVVEAKKNRLIEEIIKVAEKIKVNPSSIEILKQAKEEVHFSNAVDKIKDAMPSTLLIDGHHNPLKLLHSALSDGLHAKTDEECLQFAQSIRLVLTDLADRIGQALKSHAELSQAISRLLK
jgi:hypothetical protein